MNDIQLNNRAPAALAVHAHESRSNRYGFIPTAELLDAFAREGWMVHQASQARTRVEHKRGFTKHLIRLRRQEVAASQDTPELVVINSHDGSSSFILRAGYFRFYCLNGMVLGEDLFPILRVHHGKEALHRVIEGSYKVLDEFPHVVERVEAMKEVQLNRGEQLAFARAALPLRFERQENASDAAFTLRPAGYPLTEEQVLRPRRSEDEKLDLWTTFNVVQENLVKGGQRGIAASGRAHKTRAVNGIDQNVKLNAALWTLAEEMRKLKGN